MVYFFNQNIIQLYDTHAPMRKARITKPPAPSPMAHDRKFKAAHECQKRGF
jgi:hypothetical protein